MSAAAWNRWTETENWTQDFSADGKRVLSLQVEAGKFTLHRFELP